MDVATKDTQAIEDSLVDEDLADGLQVTASADREDQCGGSDAKLQRWRVEQRELCTRLKLQDDENPSGFEAWQHFGGVDISFVKGTELACASLVVLRAPLPDTPAKDLELVYEDFELVTMDEPYIAGFLAFREVKFLKTLWHRLEDRLARGEVDKTRVRMPDITLVDGNGVLHSRGFGLASHLGVELGIRTIGVAKTLLQVDGMTKDRVADWIDATPKAESGFTVTNLVGDSGRCWGSAVLALSHLTKPIFISCGHRVSLKTALNVVHRCCAFRIPEPVRQADLRSREWLRVNKPSPSSSSSELQKQKMSSQRQEKRLRPPAQTYAGV
mmetsp:Transcript_21526/g.38664  ORF Transcript_21526/g.38664 Transcript_21526/m.38664 type:complete len:328 (-) Transcript_21526:118-1101(-)